ncbi:phosphotransferase [Nocardioides conyzicola]|uniref:Phosphotransferase n=1 Tax=Nocardioides conyzicola TaxID=1651781 RepID=A0ABP8WLG2_9ACTN
MELIGTGRDADVFAYDDGLVLRRNRDGRSSEREGALMVRLAGLGYPLPRVHSVRGPEMVMERVDGPTLGAELFAGTRPAEEGAAILADLHRGLHALPWPGAAPGECLVHLDLHPLNVIMTGGGPVLIDWTNAREGRPGLDVAVTVLTIAQVGLADDDLRDVLLGFLAEFVVRVATPYAAELPEAVAFRRANPHQTPAEAALFDDAVELTRRWA